MMFDGFGARPMFMVSSKRREFKSSYTNASHLTFDSEVNYRLINQRKDFDVWLAVDSGFPAKNILTIQGNIIEGKKILRSLFGDNSDYSVIPRAEYVTANEILSVKGIPKLGYPNLKFIPIEGKTVEVEENEKEIKIDTFEDTRQIIENLPESLPDNLYLGPAYHRANSYFKYILVAPDIYITVKSFSPDFDIKTAFQYKSLVSDNGILERKKLTKFSKQVILDALEITSGDFPEKESTVALRERIDRTIVVSDTKNLFGLLADHCISLDGRASLNQIEIEYLGKFDFPDANYRVDLEELESDFRRIRKQLENQLGESHIKILPTHTTKFDWLTRI